MLGCRWWRCVIRKCRESVGLKAGCVRWVQGVFGAVPGQVAFLARVKRLCRGFDVVVFLGEAVADCQTPCNGGLKVALGCKWWRRVWGMQLQIARPC